MKGKHGVTLLYNYGKNGMMIAKGVNYAGVDTHLLTESEGTSTLSFHI